MLTPYPKESIGDTIETRVMWARWSLERKLNRAFQKPSEPLTEAVLPVRRSAWPDVVAGLIFGVLTIVAVIIGVCLTSAPAHGQTAGPGIVIAGTSPNQSISIEDATIPQYFAGAGAPPAGFPAPNGCKPGHLYLDTQGAALYICPAGKWILPPCTGNAVTVIPPFPAIRLRAGPAYTDSQGNAWGGDRGFIGGSPYAIDPVSSLDPFYDSVRYGVSFQYQFPVPNGDYTVTLKFAEIYWQAAGKRVFNVSINGASVLANFDIFAAAGGAFKAIDKAFPVTVTNGQIVIAFTSIVDNAMLNGVLISGN